MRYFDDMRDLNSIYVSRHNFFEFPLNTVGVFFHHTKYVLIFSDHEAVIERMLKLLGYVDV